jgi:hypothetical protein
VRRTLAIALIVFCCGRKIYTHEAIWRPAHEKVRAALKSDDLGSAAHWINVEKSYEMCGINPIWFITGGC